MIKQARGTQLTRWKEEFHAYKARYFGFLLRGSRDYARSSYRGVVSYDRPLFERLFLF